MCALLHRPPEITPLLHMIHIPTRELPFCSSYFSICIPMFLFHLVSFLMFSSLHLWKAKLMWNHWWRCTYCSLSFYLVKPIILLWSSSIVLQFPCLWVLILYRPSACYGCSMRCKVLAMESQMLLVYSFIFCGLSSDCQVPLPNNFWGCCACNRNQIR